MATSMGTFLWTSPANTTRREPESRENSMFWTLSTSTNTTALTPIIPRDALTAHTGRTSAKLACQPIFSRKTFMAHAFDEVLGINVCSTQCVQRESVIEELVECFPRERNWRALSRKELRRRTLLWACAATLLRTPTSWHSAPRYSSRVSAVKWFEMTTGMPLAVVARAKSPSSCWRSPAKPSEVYFVNDGYLRGRRKGDSRK